MSFPRRTIHLDFHTGPDVPDVGADFDPQEFARTFQEARVDSVTLFAKCHHGHLYYATERPERHPGLVPSLDLMGEQVRALQSVGIATPIYLSVQCDEWAANHHPDWLALTPELQVVKRGGAGESDENAPLALQAGWQILDMSSPYQDFLADQLDEVLRAFAPVDGLFFDMCWNQPSCSKWAFNGMRKRGLDPRDAFERDRYAQEVAWTYMARYKMMLDEVQAKRGGDPVGIWFNSRPKTNLWEERQFVRHIEVEALPTGGWGYAYFPYVSRFVRPLGLPTLSHTGRFHKSWGDNGALKPQAALRYECSQVLSQGFTGGVGDLLHPRGKPQQAVYALIGTAYKHIEACEPWVEGARHLSEVALVVDPRLGDNPGASGVGAVRALQQLRHQFDIVPPHADLAPYSLLLVPEATQVNEELRQKLREHVQEGGALALFGSSALDDSGAPLLDEQNAEAHGSSPWSHVFLRPSTEAAHGLPAFDTVMYERGFRITPREGAHSLCGVVEPYFERGFDHFSGHSYTPPKAGTEALSPFSAVVQNGRVLSFAVPLLEAFGRHANEFYRVLLGNCLAQVLPRPLVRAGGPVHLEVTAVETDEHIALHLLSFLPSREGGLDLVHDPFPLVNVPVALRMDAAPRRVSLQPQNQDVPFSFEDGYARAQVTVLDGHALLVFHR